MAVQMHGFNAQNMSLLHFITVCYNITKCMENKSTYMSNVKGNIHRVFFVIVVDTL